MSNVVKYENRSLSQQIGGGMLKLGGAGVGLIVLAALLPFAGMLTVIVLLLIGGGALRLMGGSK